MLNLVLYFSIKRWIMVRFLCSKVKEMAIKGCELNIALHWEPTVVIMTTLLSLVASEASVMVAYDFISGEKVTTNNDNCRFSVFINSIMTCVYIWSVAHKAEASLHCDQKEIAVLKPQFADSCDLQILFSPYTYWNVLWRVKQSPGNYGSSQVQEITLSRLDDMPSSEPMMTKTLKKALFL